MTLNHLKYRLFVIIITLITISIGCVGCSAVPRHIYIPVNNTKIIDIPTAPNYPTVNKNSNAPEFVKWCIISVKMCKMDDKALREIIGVYNNE